MRTILMLVRHGSLAAASDGLDVNYTTVARRIQRAEQALQTVLFERLPDGYRPTDTAKTIAEHAANMETTSDQLMRRLKGMEHDLSGPMTITAPQLLIANFLAPMIEEFTRLHPNIDLRIKATNELLDLNRREADLAIRISRDPGDTLTGLRLLKQETASFANDAVAATIAAEPSATIDWIIYDAYQSVPTGTGSDYPNNRVRYRFDDMVAMVGAAQAGLGVVRMPMFLGRATSGLVQIPVLPPQPYADIWVVGHPDVWPSAKLRAFREVLVPFCKRHQANFIGEGSNQE